MIMPNAGHSAGDMDRLLTGVMAFLRHVGGTLELPNLSWDFSVDEERGVVKASISASDDSVIQLWQASSDTTDFRNSEWTLIGEPAKGPSVEFELPLPESGKQAVFADITTNLLGSDVTFTTTPFIY